MKIKKIAFFKICLFFSALGEILLLEYAKNQSGHSVQTGSQGSYLCLFALSFGMTERMLCDGFFVNINNILSRVFPFCY